MKQRLGRLSFVWLLLFSMLALPAWKAGARQAAQTLHPGYRSLSYSLPSQHLLLKLSVWYPARRKPASIKEGPWVFRAARNAPVLDGPWPLIVLSHDSTGTSLSHHDLAASFASRGYIVVAPIHDHDNAYDMSLLFHDRELFLRALQIKSAVDLILEHPQLGPRIDRTRIAYLGFGLPSSAGLLLAGAHASSSEWQVFYRLRCADPEKSSSGGTPAPHDSPSAARGPQSPWCSPMLARKMDMLIQSMEQRTQEQKTKVRYSENASLERKRLFKRLADQSARARRSYAMKGENGMLPHVPVILPLLPPPSEGGILTDTRFAALAFVSPGFSFLFDAGSLARIQIPALFIGAAGDRLNIPQEQAERFASLMGRSAGYALIGKGDAPSFQAKCPEGDPAYALSSLCGSVSDTERAMLHQQLCLILADFFARAFQGASGS